MLGVNGTGTHKLSPYLVFKGSSLSTGRIFKELKKGEGYSKECVHVVQENAWFDEPTMLHWIDTIWKPLQQDRNMKLAYLLLDEWV
jgi:DDE superfamily endonuclease